MKHKNNYPLSRTNKEPNVNLNQFKKYNLANFYKISRLLICWEQYHRLYCKHNRSFTDVLPSVSKCFGSFPGTPTSCMWSTDNLKRTIAHYRQKKLFTRAQSFNLRSIVLLVIDTFFFPPQVVQVCFLGLFPRSQLLPVTEASVSHSENMKQLNV